MDRTPVISDRLPPPELRRALEAATDGVATATLRAAARRLSDAYRDENKPTRRLASTWAPVDYLAYAVARMPATYWATVAVCEELRVRCPELSVRRLLDIGAGPASGLWAARTVFADLASATLVEPDAGMVALGKQLWGWSAATQRLSPVWQTVDIDRFEPVAQGHDVALASYVLGELSGEQRRALVDAAWVSARGAVVLVAPGSVQGYRHIIEARDHLIGLGARIVAPCPHADRCPLPEDDWCHFAVRLNRTSLQRRLKEGALAYEDEKYVYVVATRAAGVPAAGRVIRRPTVARGRVTLRLCRQGGLGEETVPKSRREAYRNARRVQWGDSWS